MKPFIYILAAALCLIAVSDSGAMSKRPVTKPSGRIVTRDVDVQGNFTAINARGFADVEYRQSNDGRTTVEVRGDDNLVQNIEIENKGGVLEIKSLRNLLVLGKYSVTVMITSPQIVRISSHGSGDVKIYGPLESDRLELVSNGSGDVEFDRIKADELRMAVRGSGDIEGGTVDVPDVEISVLGSGDVDISQMLARNATITLSGSGDIETDGQANNAVLKVRGSGDIDADGFRAENVDATVSGSGDISCYASSSIRASASGSGTITVAGNPASVEISGNRKAVRIK